MPGLFPGLRAASDEPTTRPCHGVTAMNEGSGRESAIPMSAPRGTTSQPARARPGLSATIGWTGALERVGVVVVGGAAFDLVDHLVEIFTAKLVAHFFADLAHPTPDTFRVFGVEVPERARVGQGIESRRL